MTDVSVTVARVIDADGGSSISVSSTPNRAFEVLTLLRIAEFQIQKELNQ